VVVLLVLKGGRKPFLNPDKFQPLKLAEKAYETHNTVRLRFALPHPKQRVGLPVGQHISFKAVGPDGKASTIRPQQGRPALQVLHSHSPSIRSLMQQASRPS
jgi:cytochrome-b5 reductase